jgi:dihydrofolate reductase
MSTGAVVVGRRTFEMAGEWNGDHHGVPIFVLTRRAGDAPRWQLVTYVDDVADAMARAKAAAGERDVLVHGARAAQLALAAGVLDELEVHQVPALVRRSLRSRGIAFSVAPRSPGPARAPAVGEASPPGGSRRRCRS